VDLRLLSVPRLVSLCGMFAGPSRQVISVSTTYPVDVLVLIKLSCCPRVTALPAVTVAVVSMVAHIGSVDTIRT
jgi:hypothetical protein